MTSTVEGGLSRVTIVAPKTRVDLALPADVPLADLLPTLLRYAGDGLADEGAAHGGWLLSRLGGQGLDTSRSPAQLDIRDGELLYLTPRDSAAPEVVFDDVVDAVAVSTQERSGRWVGATTRRFGLGLGTAALCGGVLAVLFTGPPHLPGALVGLGVGIALLVTATVLSRAMGDSRTGAVFGVLAVAYAGAGGLLLLAGDRPLPRLDAAHVLVAAAVMVLYAAIAAVAVADALPAFVAAGMSAVALAVGALVSLVFGVGAAAGAAVVVTLGFALVPTLPMLAFRLARLPMPSVPTGPEELKNDNETVDGARVLERSGRADAHLSGMLAALSLVSAVAAAVLAIGGGYPGVILCAVLALLLLIRARWFVSRAQRLPMLAAGTAGLGVLAVAAFVGGGMLLRLTAVVGGLVVLALVSIVYGLTAPGRRSSPVWGRLLDLVEVLLIVGIVPLAAWVCGLYAWIRAIRG